MQVYLPAKPSPSLAPVFNKLYFPHYCKIATLNYNIYQSLIICRVSGFYRCDALPARRNMHVGENELFQALCATEYTSCSLKAFRNHLAWSEVQTQATQQASPPSWIVTMTDCLGLPKKKKKKRSTNQRGTCSPPVD